VAPAPPPWYLPAAGSAAATQQDGGLGSRGVRGRQHDAQGALDQAPLPHVLLLFKVRPL
jgi:hypothetical protein